MKQAAAAFVKAQTEFGPALKSSSNPHFKSKYADLAACVEAVIDALNNNGIGLIQATHECDTGVIVETQLWHESGEMISAGRLHVPAAKQDPQGYGSALTYARRYSLMAACGIAPEDDDANSANAAVVARRGGAASAEEVEAITKLAKTAGIALQAVCGSYSVQSLDQLPKEKVQEVIARLQKKVAQGDQK